MALKRLSDKFVFFGGQPGKTDRGGAYKKK
jgi:hypothetical protein